METLSNVSIHKDLRAVRPAEDDCHAGDESAKGNLAVSKLILPLRLLDGKMQVKTYSTTWVLSLLTCFPQSAACGFDVTGRRENGCGSKPLANLRMEVMIEKFLLPAARIAVRAMMGDMMDVFCVKGWRCVIP